jgi:hypothetical protein
MRKYHAAKDLFGRDTLVQQVVKLVTLTDEPLVLSVEGGYGTGKTTFMELLRKALTKHICVSINAWETDFFDNPLAPIVDAFISQDQIATNADVLKNSTGKAMLGAVAHSGFVKALVNAEKAEQLHKSYAGKVWRLYEEQRDSYQDLRKEIEALAKNITYSSDGASKLVVLVDELDRCRPDYAVRFLEAIKHLFAVDNVVFILAIDKGQIGAAVKHIYGYDADSEEYLARFFDMEIILPKPSSEKHFKALSEFYKDGEHFYQVAGFILGDVFKFSFRSQSRLFMRMMTMNLSTDALSPLRTEPHHHIPVLATFLLGLFYSDRKFYEKWSISRDVDEVASYLEDKGIRFEYSTTGNHVKDRLLQCLYYLHRGRVQSEQTGVGGKYKGNNVHLGSGAPGLEDVFQNLTRQISQMEISI